MNTLPIFFFFFLLSCFVKFIFYQAYRRVSVSKKRQKEKKKSCFFLKWRIYTPGANYSTMCTDLIKWTNKRKWKISIPSGAWIVPGTILMTLAMSWMYFIYLFIQLSNKKAVLDYMMEEFPTNQWFGLSKSRENMPWFAKLENDIYCTRPDIYIF